MRNGETHGEMLNLGLKYEKAFGVNVVSLKDLSKRYDRSHLLANKLWCSKLREGQIIASMLEDEKKVDLNQIERWIIEAETNEILEQLCMNLFVNCEAIHMNFNNWLNSSDFNKQKISLLLIARLSLLKNINMNSSFIVSNNIFPPESLNIKDSYIEKMCIRAYVRLAATDKESKILIKDFFEKRSLKNSEWSFICDEIKIELEYLP